MICLCTLKENLTTFHKFLREIRKKVKICTNSCVSLMEKSQWVRKGTLEKLYAQTKRKMRETRWVLIQQHIFPTEVRFSIRKDLKKMLLKDPPTYWQINLQTDICNNFTRLKDRLSSLFRRLFSIMSLQLCLGMLGTSMDRQKAMVAWINLRIESNKSEDSYSKKRDRIYKIFMGISFISPKLWQHMKTQSTSLRLWMPITRKKGIYTVWGKIKKKWLNM